MKKSIIVLMFLCAMEQASHSEVNRMCFLPFQATKQLKNESGLLYQYVAKECTQQGQCMMITENTWYPYPAGAVSPYHAKFFDNLAKKNGCSHFAMGTLARQKNKIIIAGKLYDISSKSVIYSTSEVIDSGNELEVKAQALFRKFTFMLMNKMPRITEFNAAQGSTDNYIAINWKCSTPGSRIYLYRSFSKQGSYDLIANEKSNDFRDKKTEEGIKYFYKIIPENEGVQGEPEFAWGYIKPKNPSGLTPDEALANKNKAWDKSVDKDKQKRHIELMDEFYESYFTMSFIILVGKLYVKKGELIIYRDFVNYTLNKESKTIYFHKPGITVKFVSKRFFRFVRIMEEMKIPENDLIPRLVNNSLLFCLRSGEIEVCGNDGITRFIPSFEAVGFSTEYSKNYKNWRSNTIVFGSSDKELDKKLKEAKKKAF